MSLLWIDSFDHYATADILEKYTSHNGGSILPTGGRRSSPNMRVGGLTSVLFKGGLSATGPTFVMGVAIKPITLSSGALKMMGIWDGAFGGKDQTYFQINPDGSITAVRGNNAQTSPGVIQGGVTGLGTTSVPLTMSVYTYVEFKVLLHASAGTVQVKFNGTTVLNLTGQNTAGSIGSAVWNGFFFAPQGSAGASGTIDFDDLCVLDGTGSAPWNDFLGDLRVDSRFSTAPGANTGFTPSTGANWQNVDDAAPNDDTDFNSTATVGLTDTFVVQDAPVVGSAILGIQHNLSVRKLDAGAGTIAPIVRHGGVDNVGAGLNPSIAYAFLTQTVQANPGTGLQWTEADFNAAEFGYRKTV